MSINNDQQLAKFKKLYKIFLVLAILTSLEVFTASFFKVAFNFEIEMGIFGLAVLFITPLLGLGKIGGAIGGLIHFISALLWLFFVGFAIYYRSKIKSLKTKSTY